MPDIAAAIPVFQAATAARKLAPKADPALKPAIMSDTGFASACYLLTNPSEPKHEGTKAHKGDIVRSEVDEFPLRTTSHNPSIS